MSAIIPKRYRQLRAAVPLDSVSIGYGSIHLSPVAELEAAQQGYRVVPEGEETDWRDEWIVIGYEGLCGDPIFVDTSKEQYPVYTTAHDMGVWRPQLIASTFRHFIQIVQRLQVLAHGRTNPAEMEQHPISDEESKAFVALISQDSPEANVDFWEGLYET